MVELVDLLQKLTELSIQKVDTAQKGSKIRFMIIPRIRETRRVARGKMMELSSTKIEKIVSGRFHHEDLRDFYEKEIVPTKEYQDVHQFIQKNHQEILKNLDKYSYNFFASIVHNHFWNVPPSSMEDIIDAFFNDVFEKTTPWEITIWLIGFYFEEDFQYQNITLKPPTEEDLMIERGESDPAFWLRTRRTIPSAILETIFTTNEHFKRTNDYVAKLLVSLKLFKPGIDDVMIFENPKSLVSASPQRTENIEAREHGRYLVTKNDFNELKYHVVDLPQLIPQDLLTGPYHQNTPLAVAYQCYSNAVYKLVAPNEILSEVIRGIESLYLPKDKIHGKGSRLGERVSDVLSNEGLDVQEIESNIKESYFTIRNPTFHGTPVSKEVQFSAWEWGPPLIEYLRKSILILIRDGKTSFHDRFR